MEQPPIRTFSPQGSEHLLPGRLWFSPDSQLYMAQWQEKEGIVAAPSTYFRRFHGITNYRRLGLTFPLDKLGMDTRRYVDPDDPDTINRYMHWPSESRFVDVANDLPTPGLPPGESALRYTLVSGTLFSYDEQLEALQDGELLLTSEHDVLDHALGTTVVRNALLLPGSLRRRAQEVTSALKEAKGLSVAPKIFFGIVSAPRRVREERERRLAISAAENARQHLGAGIDEKLDTYTVANVLSDDTYAAQNFAKLFPELEKDVVVQALRDSAKSYRALAS
jgi:hypothetical protein